MQFASCVQMSHALNLTTIVSLLQPPPEVFNLFDDLLLLASGKMLYHGPLQVGHHSSHCNPIVSFVDTLHDAITLLITNKVYAVVCSAFSSTSARYITAALPAMHKHRPETP